jgi:hypothetical protein
MVEAGQKITETRTREFGEEALAMMDASDEAGKKVRGSGFCFFDLRGLMPCCRRLKRDWLECLVRSRRLTTICTQCVWQ